jgi:hypothetical protein
MTYVAKLPQGQVGRLELEWNGSVQAAENAAGWYESGAGDVFVTYQNDGGFPLVYLRGSGPAILAWLLEHHTAGDMREALELLSGTQFQQVALQEP